MRGIVVAIAMVLALGACGGTAGVGTHTATPHVVTPFPPTPTPLPLVPLDISQANTSIQDADSIDIPGTTAAGATVTWNVGAGTGTVVADGAGRFVIHATGLKLGGNLVSVTATLAGYSSNSTGESITRTISEAGYKASAHTLPYPQLVKDPASLKGTIVHYKAQVFQYDTNTTTSHMIASVTDNGYGFWSDNVWLDLDPSIAASITQKDIVEFWGDVVGPYSYTTTNNGQLTIPEVHVMYVSLLSKGS